MIVTIAITKIHEGGFSSTLVDKLEIIFDESRTGKIARGIDIFSAKSEVIFF